jgi:tetratricopeptide (TPR) repeat protein
LAPAALAVYVAFLVHASWDWDWELPAVTLVALACGASLLTLGRTATLRVLPLRARLVFLSVLLLPAGFAFVTVMGQSAIAASGDAIGQGNVKRAIDEAHKAARWAPWAPEPWQHLAEARIAGEDEAGAVAAYRKALQKEPNDWRIWFDAIFVSEGQFRREAIAHARTLNPLTQEIPIR